MLDYLPAKGKCNMERYISDAAALDRTLGALLRAQNKAQVAYLAESRDELAPYVKAAAAIAHDPAWNGPSALYLEGAFAASALGGLSGYHRIQFRREAREVLVAMGGAFVAETGEIPVSDVEIGALSLRRTKAAAIVLGTDTFVEDDDGVALMRRLSEREMGRVIDAKMFSADAADDAADAGVFFDAVSVSSSGSGADDVASDLGAMVKTMSDRIGVRNAVWVLSAPARARFGLLRLTDGDRLGSLPMVTTAAAGVVALLALDRLVVAAEDVNFLVSREASLNAPGSSGGLYSLLQTNTVSLRAVASINWTLLADGVGTGGNHAAIVLSGAGYA